jgi:DNA transformation protein
MKQNNDFYTFVLHDVFGSIDGVTSKRMFGGFGFYFHGKIFAIIANGELFFKVNDVIRPLFEVHEDSHPFQYSTKDRKQVTMKYWSLPLAIMEKPSEIRAWVERSSAI